jgi:hypothetical protein
MNKKFAFIFLSLFLTNAFGQEYIAPHEFKHVYATIFLLNDGEQVNVQVGASRNSPEEAKFAACAGRVGFDDIKEICSKSAAIICGSGYIGSAGAFSNIGSGEAKRRNEPFNVLGVSCGQKSQQSADEAAVKSCEASKAKRTLPGFGPCLAFPFTQIKDYQVFKNAE